MRIAGRLGLAPRCTASRPATTPPKPTRTASQRATVATPADTPAVRRSQGGAEPDPAMGGYIQLSRTPVMAIMIRIALPIPATASRPRTRVPSALDPTRPVAGEPRLAPVALSIRLLLV